MNDEPKNKLGFIRTHGSDDKLRFFPDMEIDTKYGEPAEFFFLESETKRYKYVLQEITEK